MSAADVSPEPAEVWREAFSATADAMAENANPWEVLDAALDVLARHGFHLSRAPHDSAVKNQDQHTTH